MTWDLVPNEKDRWQLSDGDIVLATLWVEGKFWQWSAPGRGPKQIPKRGAHASFPVARKQAEEAAR